MKTIAVLTSGGDTPGMNAALRAVFKVGESLGYNVMGVYHGYEGLMTGKIRQLTHEDFENIVHKGGTVLRTARSEIFKTAEGQKHALKVIQAYQIDGLIVIGGDGSLTGANLLAQQGLPIMGLPGTIDNDLAYTDYTIGFDTAVNSVTNEIYKIRDTMRSHDRVGVVEVMGRACGDIALHAGVAGGADYILVPEVDSKEGYAKACDLLIANKLKGKMTSIVMIAEGAGGASDFCDYVRDNSDVDIRPIVLGYTQRGGNPSAFDRVNASRMGAMAVELFDKGVINRAVGLRHNKVYDVDLAEALTMKKRFDKKLYELNNTLAKF